MRVTFALSAVLAAAAMAAGCGGESVKPINGDDAPAVTAPGTTIPYEDGGADGSGSDGRRTPAGRGGVAGGPDVGSGG
jgi:hypothetical protein